MQNTQNFLTLVRANTKALQQARNSFAKSHAPDFYLIDSFSINENSLSRALSRLLDPKEAHGQSYLYLELFLKHFAPDLYNEVDRQAFMEAEIQLEKATNSNRRIDIYLDLADKAVVGIENKPWAIDQQDQLTDYANYLKENSANKKWLLLYLCNYQPSDHSISNEQKNNLEISQNLKTISFSELNVWLEKCLSKTKPVNVRLFIEELIYFITTQVNYIMNDSALSEIAKIVTENNANIETAFHIAQSLDNVKKTLMLQLKSQLEIKLRSQGMNLLPNNDDIPNRFSIAFSTNPVQKLHLTFEFDGKNFNGLWWGIKKQNENYPNSDICQAVNVKMNEYFGVAYQPNKWWSWSAKADTNNHFKDCLNWEQNPAPWVAIHDGNLAREIIEIAEKTKELFSSSDLLN
jgi:hypothetical protein